MKQEIIASCAPDETRVAVIEDGKLVEYSGEYGPQDPNCCPSVLRKTYFRWDGRKLQVEKEEKVPNPAGQKKE